MFPTLISTQTTIARTQIALIIIGNVGSAFSVWVLSERHSRRSPCALYLFAYLISNLILINHTVLMSTLNLGFNINPAAYSQFYCRLKFYLAFVFGTVPTYFLLLASFDRVLVSSVNVNLRLWSTRRVAYVAIVIVGLFWLLFHLHAFVHVDIFQFKGSPPFCSITPGSYTSFISYYALIVSALLPSMLFSAAAIRTALNMHRIRSSINSRQITHRVRSNERYLLALLLIQILFYLVTHGPLVGLSIYNEVTKFKTKQRDQLVVERFLSYLTEYLNFFHAALSPMVNFISKGFRMKSKQLLYRVLRKATRSDNDGQTPIVQLPLRELPVIVLPP